MLKLLVIGGNSQLGRSFSKIASQSAYQVISTTSRSLNITAEDCINQIINFKPDIILNFAAWNYVEDTNSNFYKALNTNCISIKRIIIAANTLKIPLFHISTDYVFSGFTNRPWKETDDPAPINSYGLTKYSGELLINELYGERSYIIRTSWLYSEYGNNFVKKILKKLYDGGENIAVVDDQFGQPTYAHDLSTALLQMIEKRINFGTYHLTNSGFTSWYSFARSICLNANFNTDFIQPINTSQLRSNITRPRYTVLDNTLIVNAGITELKNWEDSLKTALPKIVSSMQC
jgi:dTDP-4-dehydrorhamnose reductase